MSQTVTTSSFLGELAENFSKYSDPNVRQEYCAQVREQASEHFLHALLASPEALKKFESSALHRSKCSNQKTVRLESWQGRGPTNQDQSLSDLLDLGDLLQRMQDFLDQTYGKGNFRVFNHPISRTRSSALVVSWDKDGFANIDDIIERNRRKAQMRLKRQRFDYEDDDEEDQVQRDESRDKRDFRHYRGEGAYSPRLDDKRHGNTRDRGGYTPRLGRVDQAAEQKDRPLRQRGYAPK